jgi:hypothetical protein
MCCIGLPTTLTPSSSRTSAATAQRLYDASTPGLMIGDVLGALEVFRTTMEATDGT